MQMIPNSERDQKPLQTLLKMVFNSFKGIPMTLRYRPTLETYYNLVSNLSGGVPVTALLDNNRSTLALTGSSIQFTRMCANDCPIFDNILEAHSHFIREVSILSSKVPITTQYLTTWEACLLH